MKAGRSFHVLLRIAGKEFREASRTRWVLVMAFLLTVLPLLVSALGLGVAGGLKAQGFARTTASMVNLSIYLVPLLGLQLAHASLVGEAERGTLRLLASQPVDRWAIVAGKYAGLCLLLSVLLGGSFAAAGLFVGLRAGPDQVWDYLAFVASAIVLGWGFVGIGLWLSAAARDRAQALTSALGTWFFFSVLEDLLLLAVFVGFSQLLIAPDYAPAAEVLHRELASGWTGDEVRFPWISGLVLFNPTDVFRLWNILRTPAMREAMALTRSLPAWLANAWTLSTASLLWTTAPLLLAIRRFERLEID